MTVHWDRSVQSVMVEVGERAVAVRASKASVSRRELFLVADSLPALES